MQFRRYLCLDLCLVALLVVGLAGNAKADARIEDFFGSYTGSGFATDHSGASVPTQRDFTLVIGPLAGGGFEIAWSTIKRKGNDPDSLETKVSKHAARFRSPNESGVFHDIDQGILFGLGAITWARLQRNLLVVYRMDVDENGVGEMHVYQRMLTAGGLELLFTATRDNNLIRSVWGSYQRREPNPKVGDE